MKRWQIVFLSVLSLLVVGGLIMGVVTVSNRPQTVTPPQNTPVALTNGQAAAPSSPTTTTNIEAASEEITNSTPTTNDTLTELEFEANTNQEVFDLTPDESEVSTPTNSATNTSTSPSPADPQETNANTPAATPTPTETPATPTSPSVLAGQWEITATLKSTETGDTRSMKVTAELAPNGTVSFPEEYDDDVTRFTAQHTGTYEIQGSTWKYRDSATGSGTSEAYGGPFSLKFSAVVDGTISDDRKTISGTWLMTELYTSNQKTTIKHVEGVFQAIKK